MAATVYYKLVDDGSALRDEMVYSAHMHQDISYRPDVEMTEKKADELESMLLKEIDVNLEIRLAGNVPDNDTLKIRKAMKRGDIVKIIDASMRLLHQRYESKKRLN